MPKVSESASFQVIVRVRPLTEKEQNQGHQSILNIVESQLINIAEKVGEGWKDPLTAKHLKEREKQFAFDTVFSESATQRSVFLHTTAKILASVCEGYNATVFAYGATGAGKTYTMLGNKENQGIIPLTVNGLFEELKKDDSFINIVTVSYVEVYNERLMDLLDEDDCKTVELREDPIRGVAVSGASSFPVTSVDQVLHTIECGNARRHEGATSANEFSSRSHAVCQVVVERKPRTAGVSTQIVIGKLSLIDLAGSERASASEATGKRLQEGANINRSLLALANCINALGNSKKKGAFVPYRDSKLTRMLKDSLGGNCRTVMITNVSPSDRHYEETVNSLKYASRAKNIRIKAGRNVKQVHHHVREYQKIIDDLRNEISELKMHITDSGGHAPSCDNTGSMRVFKNLWMDLNTNFQERIELRRAICDIQNTNIGNHEHLESGEVLMQSWKSQGEGGASLAEQLAQTQSLCDTIKSNTDKNENILADRRRRLAEMQEEYGRLKAQVAQIRKTDRRQFLDMLVRSNELEVSNMELTLQVQLKDKIIGEQSDMLEAAAAAAGFDGEGDPAQRISAEVMDTSGAASAEAGAAASATPAAASPAKSPVKPPAKPRKKRSRVCGVM